MNKPLKTIQNIATTSITQIILIPTGVVAGIILARVLGPSSKGIYYYTLLIPQMIATFSQLGVSTASIYWIGKKKYGIHEVFGNQIILACILGFVGWVGFRVVLLFYSSMFRSVPHNLLMASLILVPFNILIGFLYGDLLAMGMVSQYNLIRLLEGVLSTSSFIVLNYFGKITLTSAVLTSGSLVIVITASSFFTLFKRYKPQIILSRTYLKDTIGYGSRTYLNNLVGSLNRRVDVFIIAAILTSSDLGQYSIAVNLGELLWLFTDSITLVLFPEFTKIAEAQLSESAAKTTRNFLLISLVAAIGLFIGASIFIPILYGDAYRPSIELLGLILPGIWVFSIVKIFNIYWSGNGRPEVNIIPLTVAVFSNIPFNLVLLPIIGIRGASISSTISYTLAALIHLIFFIRSTRVKLKDVLIINRNDVQGFKQIYTNLTSRFIG